MSILKKIRDALISGIIIFAFPMWMAACGMTASTWKWPWVFLVPMYTVIAAFFLFLSIGLPLAMIGFYQANSKQR